MTTFVRSRRNDNVLIAFFALVAVAIAIRTAVAGSTALAVISGLVAAALIGFGVWLNRRPGLELRVSPTEIVLASPQRVIGRIGHAEAGGQVMVHQRIHRGRAWFSLAVPGMADGPRLPLEGFRVPQEELEAACATHGWRLAR